MCANQADVKFVTGHLTQANIKCIDLDDQYSGNQMSKLFYEYLQIEEKKIYFQE